MPNAQTVRESGALLEAAADAPRTRRQVQIITPGWGSSGYYSAAVLEAAATARVIPAGTHMYLNHSSETERHDRPERDVRDIAAVLAEDAVWDGTRLIAEADILAPYVDLVEALAPHIGVSISGSATDITIGEAEGRTGPIIEGLASVQSVDFVTKAGRGGKILESARPSVVVERAVEHGVAEATANDTREALQTALRDAYGIDRTPDVRATWVWVRDFDDTRVWFEIDGPTSEGLFEQAYTQDAAGAVTLTGTRVEVRVQTTYVPVARPGSTTTTESQEDTMPNIEEARLRQLETDAGRVPTLESERDTAVRERDEAQRALAERDRADRARQIITERATEAGVEFSRLEVAGLLAQVAVTEAGALDEAAFTALVNEAATEAAGRGTGSGLVTGNGAGSTGTGGEVSEADLDALDQRIFGTIVKGA